MLLAAFDVNDDTVALKKAIFPEIIAELKNLALDKHGRKVWFSFFFFLVSCCGAVQVLLYLLAPRSPKYFIPEFISLLSQGDGNPNRLALSAVSCRSHALMQQEGPIRPCRRAARGNRP